MKRHDETLLWQYAARELCVDEAALTEHHLEECVDCRERLLDVRQARLVLQDAQTPRPRVEWAKVDQGISQLVEARLARQAKASPGWRLPFTLAFAAVAAVVVVSMAGKIHFTAPGSVTVAHAVEPAVVTHVNHAVGLSRVGVTLSPAREGEQLTAGQVLRTAVGGRGVVTLADGSRMRLAGGSQLALTRVDANDVALTLERGRVGVQASHRARRGFVVHANGMSVRVVGTLFTVSQVQGAVEVTVAEGKVLVEPPEGEGLSLMGGERVRFERGGWKPIRGAATAAQLAELNDFSEPPLIEAAGIPRTPAAGVMPATAIARRDDSTARKGAAAIQPSAQVIGVALTPEPVPSQTEANLPKKPAVPDGQATVWPAHVGALKAPAPTAEEEAPQLEEKASIWPSFGGGPTTYEPRVLKRKQKSPAESPVVEPKAADVVPLYQREAERPVAAVADDTPVEFGEWPQAASPPAPKPEPVVAADTRPVPLPSKVRSVAPRALKNEAMLPEDLEALFLQRAERGLERGICERYLLGLQEIAADTSRNDRSEQARILRARCFDARVRPDLSEIEYRRYLEVWPRGRHSDEARKAIIE